MVYMKSLTSVRLRAGLIAFALVLSQVVMPVQSAFATGGSVNNPNNGTYQPVWCHLTGNDWRAQLGNLNSGDRNKAFALLMSAEVRAQAEDNIDLTIANGVQVMAHDRSDKLDALCEGQSVIATPSITATPLCDALDTIVWNYDDDKLTMLPATPSYDVDKRISATFTPLAPYVLKNTAGVQVSSLTLEYTDVQPVDCVRQATLPTPATTDPCGIGNAIWAEQAETSEYSWAVVDGQLIVTAKDGFYFVVNGQQVSSFNFGYPVEANTIVCPRVVPPCTVSAGSTMVTKDTQFADYQETKSSGHYVFTDEGLRIYTDDNSSNAKVAWYHSVDYSLSQVGEPSMTYVSTEGIKPGLQLVVDFDGDGSNDGILVGEEVYGNNWWLTNSSKQFVKDGAPSHSGGYGSANNGTLSQWLTSFPLATVKAVGFSLGSGVKADGVLKSLTFGCYTWTFKKAPRVPSVCTVTDNMYDRVWKYDGDNFPQAGADPAGTPGSFDFQDEGLYLNTPAIESYAYGFIDAGNTPMIDVDAMSYKVLRQTKSAGFEATLPAYILLVDTNGSAAGGMKYFFYEPYNNDQTRAAVEGSFQTWDALAAGNAKWYMSGTGQTVKTWSSFVAEFPEAVVLAYGFNQGTYNAETYSVVQDIEFDCATTSFRYFQGMGGVGGETPVTPTPSVPTAGSGATEQPLLPAELPMTGSGGMLSTWFALLAAILTYGAVLYLQPKKRLEE